MNKIIIVLITLLFASCLNNNLSQKEYPILPVFNEPITNDVGIVPTSPPYTPEIISKVEKQPESKLNEISKIERLSNQEENEVFEKSGESYLDIAYKFAPIIFQETNKDKRSERWDFIPSIDFDGDLISNNNEESIKDESIHLPATIYYDLLETSTHYFITYSLFHPLDWDTKPAFIPYTWHENDMENIQVVISKEKDSVILLATQAHLNTEVSTRKSTGIKSSDFELIKPEFVLLDSDLNENGNHVAIYVEAGGHGIYSVSNKKKKFKSFEKISLKEGFVFFPDKLNSPDFYQANKSNYKYQIKSIYDNFWLNYLDDKNIGDDKLFDGDFDYQDEIVSYEKIPRHFDSNRHSGPGKSDAGILPFAFSYSLTSKDLGVLFFNPAKKYIDTLNISEPWAREYIFNPYINKINLT